MKTIATNNDRLHKGTRLMKVLNDYTVVDIETTGTSSKYDDIIEVAAIKVRDGKEIDSYQSFLKINYPIPEFIVALTGITDEMIKDSPTSDVVLKELMCFISDDIVIAHNAHFDINFLYDKCEKLKLDYFSNDFIDTIPISRRSHPHLKSHSLSNLVKEHNFDDSNSHRALNDARNTFLVYQLCKEVIVLNNIELSNCHVKLKASSISTNKDDFNIDNPFYQKYCTFTGKLEQMERKVAMQYVADAGGFVTDSVNKLTNFLVFSETDYKYNLTNPSSKLKKAQSLILKEQELTLLSESTFYNMIFQK